MSRWFVKLIYTCKLFPPESSEHISHSNLATSNPSNPICCSLFSSMSASFCGAFANINIQHDVARNLGIQFALIDLTVEVIDLTVNDHHLAVNDHHVIDLTLVNVNDHHRAVNDHHMIDLTLDEDQFCVICQSVCASSGESMVWTPCFHAFHLHCMNSWLDYGNTCPVCKTSF